MLNNLVVWSRTGKEGSQHAYFPGRGVATAWEEVLSNLDKYENIYEFDLKGFFDKVNLDEIYRRLRSNYGYPGQVAAFFRKLNRSIIRLTNNDLLPEKERMIYFNSDLERNANLPASISIYNNEESRRLTPHERAASMVMTSLNDLDDGFFVDSRGSYMNLESDGIEVVGSAPAGQG